METITRAYARDRYESLSRDPGQAGIDFSVA
jgi:hypothetical protein